MNVSIVELQAIASAALSLPIVLALLVAVWKGAFRDLSEAEKVKYVIFSENEPDYWSDRYDRQTRKMA